MTTEIDLSPGKVERLAHASPTKLAATLRAVAAERDAALARAEAAEVNLAGQPSPDMVRGLAVALCESCIAPEAMMIAGKPRGMSDEMWQQIVSALEQSRAALAAYEKEDRHD